MRMADSKKRIKLVVVGEGGVGKTCLVMTYVEKMFPTENVPRGRIII